MEFRERYRNVLVALNDGQPKTSNEICLECGFPDRWACTGAISVLRRMDAIDQAGHGKYKITEKGRLLLGEAGAGSKVLLSKRETRQ